MLKNQELPNGQTLHYYQKFPQKQSQDKNQKPILIFVHGNFSNYQWWLDTINHPALSCYHIISIDLRGFGKSTYNNPCSKFADWANDLGLFIKSKNLKKVNLIGWSFGGSVVMKTAELFPEYVQKIVPTCSISHKGLITQDQNGSPCTTKQALSKNQKIAFSLKILDQKDKKTMRVIFDTLLFQKMSNYPQQKKQILVQGPFLQRNYLDLLLAISQSDIQIQKIKAKALMIHGVEDMVITYESVKQTGGYLKNFQGWQNHAHMIPVQDIDRYATRIAKFFNEQ